MSAFCDEVEKLGKGIGNTGRYSILESLMKGPKTVSEVVKIVKISQPRVSQHLKVLKESNLVSDERRGQEVYYSINVAHMAALLKNLALNIQKCPKQKT